MRRFLLLALLVWVAVGCSGGGVSEETAKQQKDIENKVNAKQEIPPGEGPAY
ncbi:MAG: hypothetical protein M9921_09015 [Fimbriimonadaceae bacterium]|nr:hypothetical protein [Chthonomonadaceae bacterium]MCO5296985.1 hypothetical protein [Fimbriimonadaceae bacterium]